MAGSSGESRHTDPPDEAFIGFSDNIIQGHSPDMIVIHICHCKDASNQRYCFAPM